MQKVLKPLRIIGQVVVILLMVLAASLLIELKLPGHANYTDQDSIIIGMVGILFVLLTLGLIINSLHFYIKLHWRKYRLSVISFSLILSLITFLPRKYYIRTLIGKQNKYLAKVHEQRINHSINIKLFQNKKFLSYTYDGNLSLENIGTYSMDKKGLKLNFKGEMSEHLGTEFKREQDTLICTNCKRELKLVENKN